MLPRSGRGKARGWAWEGAWRLPWPIPTSKLINEMKAVQQQLEGLPASAMWVRSSGPPNKMWGSVRRLPSYGSPNSSHFQYPGADRASCNDVVEIGAIVPLLVFQYPRADRASCNSFCSSLFFVRLQLSVSWCG